MVGGRARWQASVRIMKVLHLNTCDDGGSYEYASALSHALIDVGVNSTVATRMATARPVTDRWLRRGSLKFARGPWHGTWRTWHAPDPDQLRDVDVVHLHTVADWFNLPQWLDRLPAGVAVVVGMHDMWHISGGCFIHSGCDQFVTGCGDCPLLRFPVNRVFAAAEVRRKAGAYRRRGAAFVANSEWVRLMARRSKIAEGCEIAVVVPPVDLAVFMPGDRGACRNEFGLEPHDLVVAAGCAALTDTNKDMSGLFEALAALKEPRLRVLAFGAGSVRVPEGLQVVWAGKVASKERLARLYAAADVFASASRMETYGLTLVEALCCGTPVVAYRVGGVPEAAPAGDYASLCAPGDRSALADAVRSLLHAPRRVPPEYVTSVIGPRNGAAAVAGATLQIYQQLLASNA